MSRALVTGGAGFIGSHVADLYLEHGYDVTVLDNFSSVRRENLPARATLVELDLTSPQAARVVRDGRFDVISHLGAQIDVRKSVADPMHDASINIVGTLNLIEAVRASGHATRFIFSSTGGALYGDFVTPPNVEEYPKDPESPYGIAKLSAELYLAYYARVHRVDTVALRYANVYGPRQDPHGEAGVVAIFCNRILTGQPLTVFGDGSQTRDYVFVKDVARANVLASTAALPPGIDLDAPAINIATGIQRSVLDLTQSIGQVMKVTPELEFAPPRPGELFRSSLAIGKAKSVLGWAPEVRFEDGLKPLIEWFKKEAR